MFRKRKTIAPHFRIPNPTNPIMGDAEYLYPPKKEFTRFVLTEAMTTADEVVDAEIEDDYHSWGPSPIYHSVKKIHVHNQLTKETDVYTFSGSIGDCGIASWDQNMEWRVLTMLLPVGLRGGCLVNNHPGRNSPFDIYLGTWDSAQNKWIYDEETTVKAIDWRFGVPYPGAGSTGLFEARSSDTHGTLWETVALDCTSPGDCGD